MTTDKRKEVFLNAYKSLIESGGFLKMLSYRAKGSLSRFSLNNITLLMWQALVTNKPMPTILKTYQQWQGEGRQVQRYEHGWYVYGPHFRKPKKGEECDDPNGILTGFHIIHEFDITQTEGEPYLEAPAPLTTQTMADALIEVKEWAKTQGFKVREREARDCGSAKGWYDKKTNEIALSMDLSTDEAFSVLIHELIHAQGVSYEKYERKDAEMIAETAAAIVCLGYGLDTLGQATDYVAWWAGQDPERAISLLEKAEREARTLEKKLKPKKEKVAA